MRGLAVVAPDARPVAEGERNLAKVVTQTRGEPQGPAILRAAGEHGLGEAQSLFEALAAVLVFAEIVRPAYALNPSDLKIRVRNFERERVVCGRFLGDT